MADSNRRRGARIATSVSFEIVGAGSAPALRRGDISSSGLYVQGDPEAGEVGTVKHIRVGLPGGDELTEVIARVVRRVLVEDVRGLTVIGVAFEFLFAEDESRRAIAQLVEDVAERRRGDSGRRFAIEHAFDAEVGRPTSDRHDATVYVVGTDNLSLETAWRAEPGEVIECVVRAPHSHREFTFTGSVVSAEPTGDTDRFRVDIRFAPDQAMADPVVSGASIEKAINALLDESIRPGDYGRPPGSSADMRGNTASVPLHSLMTLAEMERLTGVLLLGIADGTAGTVYLREGRVVDVELASGEGTPRDALAAMLEWSDADFEYKSRPVVRDDRIDADTWVLLLEAARDRDERNSGGD